jgi:hypothetical protein
MKLHVEWDKPVVLKDARRENLIYKVDLAKLPTAAGIYIFGRRWGHSQFEALYVGKAGDLRGRIKGHFNNLRLMQHLQNAKSGKRLILAGRIVTLRGQRLNFTVLQNITLVYATVSRSRGSETMPERSRGRDGSVC